MVAAGVVILASGLLVALWMLPLGVKLTVLGLLVLSFLLWMAVPAFQGYHLGCDVTAGDHERLVHFGLLWCR